MKNRTRLHTMAWSAVAALLATAPWAHAASVTVRTGSAEVRPEAIVTVPVTVRGAQGMGPLQLDLVYDAAVLQPGEPAIEIAAAMPGSMVEFNVIEPGRLRIAMISGEPVQGDAEVLTARFVAKGSAGRSAALKLEGVRAWDHARNLEMLVSTENGTITIAKAGLTTANLVVIGGAVLAVVIVTVVAALRRRHSVGERKPPLALSH